MSPIDPGHGGAPGTVRMEAARRDRIRRRLAGWYRRHRRDLPWRTTGDPYAVWVSELMLQQTTVRSAVPYYERFMRALPDVRALARAPLEEVLSLWSGLGYYRRARQLHAAARQVMEHHGGHLPSDPELLGRLPGIGPYTAGAILSIAFDRSVPVVDGNVARVLARLQAIDGEPHRAATRRELWASAAELVPRRRPGDHNQALMELGALVCTPRQADCPRCPVRCDCRAWQTNRVAELPTPTRRQPTRGVRMATVVAHRGPRHNPSVLLVQRPEDGVMAGLWETPSLEIAATGGLDLAAIRRSIENLAGVKIDPAVHLGHHRHAIMNRRIRLEILSARLARKPAVRRGSAMTLVAFERLSRYPLTGAARKALDRFLAGTTSRDRETRARGHQSSDAGDGC